MSDEVKSPIKSGWRGNLNGVIEKTDSELQVSAITVKLDHATAWALCNLLTDSHVLEHPNLENDQRVMMSEFGAALGRLIDHHAANNGGRKLVK